MGIIYFAMGINVDVLDFPFYLRRFKSVAPTHTYFTQASYSRDVQRSEILSMKLSRDGVTKCLLLVQS